MNKVVFVGDQPASSNLHSDIPFIGTKSFNELVKWIKIIAPDYYILFNSNNKTDLKKIQLLYDNGFKVIALGHKAHNKICKNTSITDSYRIDHPSGLNRNLNNKQYVNKMLQDAKDYVNVVETKGT